MWEVVIKIWFAIAVIPALVINEGYKKLRDFAGKHGVKIDWFDMSLVFAIILLLILLLNGFRW